MATKNLNPKKLNCRFRRSFVRKDHTYTVSFKGLSKDQANIVSYIFRSLSSVGVVQTFLSGFTIPELELRCSIPLQRGVGKTLVVPNCSINELARLFNNYNFISKDVLVTSNGTPLSNIQNY